MTENEIRQTIWMASWQTQGRAPKDGDYAYWLGIWDGLEARGKEIGMPDYAVRKLLGWQATGADVPPYGDYANPRTPYFSPVPPYPGDAPAPAQPPPASSPAPPASTAAIDARLDRIEQLLARLVEKVPPDYTGTIRLPAMLGGGTRTVLLRAINRGNT